MLWKYFNGVYVSDYGEIRKPDGKLIKPYVHVSRGIFYLRVSIKGKKYLIHRLVYELFIGPIEPGMQIDHVDGNSFNCFAGNLMKLTGQQNRDKKRNKIFFPKNGIYIREVDDVDSYVYYYENGKLEGIGNDDAYSFISAEYLIKYHRTNNFIYLGE